MGLHSFLARLFVFAIILVISFVAVSTILGLIGAGSAAIGLGQTSGSTLELFSNETLALAVSACVGVFFTIPASLALVGHAGAWFRHVVSRSAKHLGVVLVCCFGLYLVGNAGGLDFTSLGGLRTGTEALLMLAASSAVLAFVASRTSVLRISARLYDGFAGTAQAAGRKVQRRVLVRTTVELRTTPTKQIREKEKPERVRAEMIRFQRLVQTLSSMGGRTELRLSFGEGSGKFLISLWGTDPPEKLRRLLLAVVKAHLPEYGAVASEVPPRDGLGSSLQISGIPEAVENPLEPMSRYFLDNGIAGEYLVVLERGRTNPFRRVAARLEQKNSAGKSGGQRTRRGTLGEEQSAPVKDYVEEVRLEESVKVIETEPLKVCRQMLGWGGRLRREPRRC